MSAPLRVAVTSRDGVSVNERFHRAVDDLIFDLSAEGVVFVERRLRPVTQDRAQRDFDLLGEHLADCQALLSLEFTRGAQKALNGKGFAVHQGRGEIERSLREILSQTSSSSGRPGKPPSQE